jgi:hypothetical protein
MSLSLQEGERVMKMFTGHLHLPVTAYFEHLMPALFMLATYNPVTNVTAFAGG